MNTIKHWIREGGIKAGFSPERVDQGLERAGDNVPDIGLDVLRPIPDAMGERLRDANTHYIRKPDHGNTIALMMVYADIVNFITEEQSKS